ncbi:MAG: ComF family protein, partial [Bacteroidota bacterium]
MPTLLSRIERFGLGLESLFFPRICLGCDKGLDNNEAICLSCREKLPYTNFHLLPENPVTDRLAARIPLTFGGAYLHYRSGTRTQRIIHALKYYNRPGIGTELGKLYGEELQNVVALADISGIIPVPLHPKRYHQRGYNQATYFARGLADSLQKEVWGNALKRRTFEASQTQKDRLNRARNVSNTFVAGHRDCDHQHVLLVDDVLTTGATLEA